ncbi:MAG: histidine--tRNA ligase [Candidatus Moranbacteria bacterium CG10_big_fil_rev_8_21_14_0_10_35_21]|nr:MAG: histidine--tRNA ligase [Candidatus Moranbacteria bacterium CG10_big_fil_rev_8_21_14_0_10_35_21]PJA88998.1 MAG: histidine--tRNA ligase [Candidatus Moranbacteria bacterium CG_4_9_14_3_um_filter_36_9]
MPKAKKITKRKKIKSSGKNKKKQKSLKEPKKIEPVVLRPLRGMKDILPLEQPYWEHVRRVTERLARDYGFSRIDVPVVEFSNLYVRSIGEETDIVEKEMYTFTTRGGDKAALRPEMTAGIARAYVQYGMNVWPKPVKLFSTGTLYRYDRPQEGRYREHHQVNFDAFGEQDPILDAQMIHVAYRVVQNLGLKSVEIQVNSIGCPSCRKEYRDLLVSYLESKNGKLCQDCRRRLEKNPLRVLDCKEDKCSQVASAAPQSVDHLCDECRIHFKSLLEYLDELDLPYVINPQVVRGLDYYTKTVFEVWSGEEEGKKFSLGGGGRYDGLIKIIGGENTSAVGFGLGVERIILEMKRIQAKPYRAPRPKVFLAQLGELAKKKSLKLFSELEKNGILAAENFGRGGLRSQLRVADKLGVELALILGQKEALDGTVMVKNMATGVQETVSLDKLVDLIKKKLKADTVVVYKQKT